MQTKQVKKNSSPLNQRGWGRNTLSDYGTGSINGMEEATFLPRRIFHYLYPVHGEHKNNQPFPLNGTFWNLSQIVRSIHSYFRKVKLAWRAVFTAYDCFARRFLKNRMKKMMAIATTHAGMKNVVCPLSSSTSRKPTLLILLKIPFMFSRVFCGMVIFAPFLWFQDRSVGSRDLTMCIIYSSTYGGNYNMLSVQGSSKLCSGFSLVQRTCCTREKPWLSVLYLLPRSNERADKLPIDFSPFILR